MRKMTVRIDTPRGGFVKRRDDGLVDFVSPLPSPFHYGSVPGTTSSDGDRLDALVLGGDARRGSTLELPVVGVVDFLDAGEADPKMILSDHPPTRLERAGVVGFFRVYAIGKRLLYLARRRGGDTRLIGVRWEAA